MHTNINVQSVSVEDLQQQAAAEHHPDAIGADLDAVGETELARIEHADCEAVRGDVLRGCDQVERERRSEQQHVVAVELQLLITAATDSADSCSASSQPRRVPR